MSYVRPLVEYACSVWDPHVLKDIEVLESAQNVTARMCLN